MPSKIIVNNCYSFLQTDDNTKHLLWNALRFREKNYFHSRLYKQKRWDGFTDFFKKETGRFLTGLLPEVELVLNHKKIDYSLEDHRDKIEFDYDSIDEHFLKQWLPAGEEPFDLYDYQVELTNKALRYYRGIIHAPTSAGKSKLMMCVLKCIKPKTPTLILAGKSSLIDQIYQEMLYWKFPHLGRLYGKHEEPNIITCATVQSLHKIQKILPKIKVLIVDEIHEMMSARPKKFYNKMTSCCFRLGVSATPFKFGGTEQTQKYAVKGYFGAVLKPKDGVLTTAKLQERKILSKSRCTFYPITEPQLEYEIYIDAVTRGIAESYYFHNIVKKLALQQKGRTLILVERIAHGDALNSLIPGSLWVRGKDDIESRKIVINQLQKSDENIIAIATQGIFNAGINVFIHNLINAAGGQADHHIIQRMGRGLRTANDKEILNYYDFIFKINQYLEAHSKKRVKILKKEGHEIIIKDSIDI